MRTTLKIDDDVLAAARALAAHKGGTVGDVISDLARRSLKGPTGGKERNGIPLLPKRDVVVTSEIVNAMRDELP